MSALAIPKKLSLNKVNIAMCKRLGVRFNDKDCGNSVIAYDLETQTITLVIEGKHCTKQGKVEVYWR